MRLTVVRGLVAVLLLLPGVAAAQFGHPLKGSWSGQWESGGSSEPQRLLIRIDWDGKALSGTINPGSNGAAITAVDIDYTNPMAWKVTMRAERKDASGTITPITVEGTLENLGAYRRSFHGTWTEGGRTGPFVLTRN